MRTDTVIAANRFGLGARPGDLDKIDRDPRRWLLEQLAGPSQTPAELRDLPGSASVFVEVREIRRMQRELRQSAEGTPAADVADKYGRAVRRHYLQQTGVRYRNAAATDYPFYERLVHFWSNHFAISADKQPIPALAGLFENEAIRPNICGKFEDLLIAAEKHPAMIVYLDNQRSIGPNSKFGKRANRRQSERQYGLNENLAREILELHTLGVGGGYTQQDVTSFARVITGWSVGGANERGRFADGVPGTFEFRENIHEPGNKQVLGRSYSQDGVRQGEAVLRDLAMHPATAKFIASKLARHFVTDDPGDDIVGQLSRVYLDNDGELGAVYEALVNAPATWATPATKYKTPHDFVISTLRAFSHVPDDGRFVVAALDLMGQTPFRPGSPEGWPDTAEQWGGADALYKRIEWSNTVARVVGNRGDPILIAEQALGPMLSPATRTAVSRAESAVQGTTLFLASPDFQQR